MVKIEFIRAYLALILCAIAVFYGIWIKWPFLAMGALQFMAVIYHLIKINKDVKPKM